MEPETLETIRRGIIDLIDLNIDLNVLDRIKVSDSLCALRDAGDDRLALLKIREQLRYFLPLP